MLRQPSRSYSLSIEPCREAAGAFRWLIRCPAGKLVKLSPYAFASKGGAQVSGACWLDALRAG